MISRATSAFSADFAFWPAYVLKPFFGSYIVGNKLHQLKYRKLFGLYFINI